MRKSVTKKPPVSGAAEDAQRAREIDWYKQKISLLEAHYSRYTKQDDEIRRVIVSVLGHPETALDAIRGLAKSLEVGPWK